MQIAQTAILLSGGMDSVALAYLKKPAIAYTINYGQAAAVGEIRAATSVCEQLEIDHHVIDVDCSGLGSGDMAGRAQSRFAPVPEWWPYRNQLIVTLAAIKAIEHGVKELMVGSVRGDAQHKDGTREFYARLDAVMALQEGNIRISAPGLDMTTTELVRVSNIPQEILGWSHSCHTGEFACGVCRGCMKHAGCMKELGYADY